MVNPLEELSDIYRNSISEDFELPPQVQAKVTQHVKAIRYRARRDGVLLPKAYNDYVGQAQVSGTERTAIRKKLGLAEDVKIEGLEIQDVTNETKYRDYEFIDIIKPDPIKTVESAVEYFYEEGLNVESIDKIIEEVGLDDFVEFIDDGVVELNEERSARKASVRAPSYEKVKADVDKKDAAKKKAKKGEYAPSYAKKETDVTVYDDKPARKPVAKKAPAKKPVAKPAPKPVAKKPATQKVVKAVAKVKKTQPARSKSSKETLRDKITTAYKAGVKRHKKAVQPARVFAKGMKAGAKKTVKFAKDVKKAVVGEASNWRYDLREVEGIPAETDEKMETRVGDKKKKVNNKILINPEMKEEIENLGGKLIEVVEIEEAVADAVALSPQELQIQRRKALLDVRLARSRRSSINKIKNDDVDLQKKKKDEIRQKVNEDIRQILNASDEELTEMHEALMEPKGVDSQKEVNKATRKAAFRPFKNTTPPKLKINPMDEEKDPPSQFEKGDDDRGNPDYMKSVSYADEQKWKRLQRMRKASKKDSVRAKVDEEKRPFPTKKVDKKLSSLDKKMASKEYGYKRSDERNRSMKISGIKDAVKRGEDPRKDTRGGAFAKRGNPDHDHRADYSHNRRKRTVKPAGVKEELVGEAYKAVTNSPDSLAKMNKRYKPVKKIKNPTDRPFRDRLKDPDYKVDMDEEKKALPKLKMYRQAGNLARKGDPESMKKQTKIVSVLNKETSKGYKDAALAKLRDGGSPKHQTQEDYKKLPVAKMAKKISDKSFKSGQSGVSTKSAEQTGKMIGVLDTHDPQRSKAKSKIKEDKAFDSVVAKLRKQHGKDSVITKDNPPKPPTEAEKKASAAHRAKIAAQDTRDDLEKSSQGRYSRKYSNAGSD